MENTKQIEEKWRKCWEEENLGEFDPSEGDKYYILTMFPYPSGDRLHMGHWYQYGIMDTWARYQKMRGKNVFQPMGFDAFGLPAENFAIKKGIHPDVSTKKNVSIMMEQFKKMGVSYAWKNLINTSTPDYYKWTQWLFLQLYKNKLAYQKKAPVNWCPQCQTVLANEQVVEGLCERCDSQVAKKNLQQWFFKITQYSQALLDGIEGLKWPEKTKLMQKHWIGRGDGSHLSFPLEGEDPIEVFTTRPDTLYGVSYLVLAPEHTLVDKITTAENKKAVEEYRESAAKLSEIDRQSTEKEKSGVFTGAYATHPLTGKKVPIWISDYVLVSYGTGAVMGVPAHDARDNQFAKKFNLPIVQVVEGEFEDSLFTGEGPLMNSEEFNGLIGSEARVGITKKLEEKNLGKLSTIYRLRDWLVSRQRYWGAPIPIIHCDNCGAVEVPEKDLPVVLPDEVDFKPTGESPLKRCESWINVDCPNCGKNAKREADTLDTFVCSSWYFLRYPSSTNDQVAFDKEQTKKMLPVDKYVGGPEHACMHLLYARFITHVLNDLGHVDFKEPFPDLTHQGLVLGEDGQKMSKSKGNSVSPDPLVDRYGSDILRLYLMFGFNFVDGGPWSEGGVKAVVRFRDRVNRFFETHAEIVKGKSDLGKLTSEDKKLLHLLHSSISRIQADMEKLQFNTSLARLMEILNGMSSYAQNKEMNQGLLAEVMEKFLLLLAPFAPHFCEEWWDRLGKRQHSIFKTNYPDFDKKFLTLDEITMAIMVGGKLRDTMTVDAGSSKEAIIEKALSSAKVQKQIEGKTRVKEILVPGKLVNFIVK